MHIVCVCVIRVLKMVRMCRPICLDVFLTISFLNETNDLHCHCGGTFDVHIKNAREKKNNDLIISYYNASSSKKHNLKS